VIRWRDGRVVEVGAGRTGAVELRVATSDGEVAAVAYPDLVGEPAVGDRVLLNTNAQAMCLGTGGFALVVALPDRLPADRDEPGHIVKARYTPLQTTVLGVDEPASPHHAALQNADDLAGLPVVVADLHSALPAVIAGLREDGRTPRVVYVMTDGGALPLGLSQTVQGLRTAGWLAATITVGQAFGGDLEAVTVHSGLLAARIVLDADVVIVTQGPGNLGTATRWGFSGVASGETINAVAALGGRPVATLRISAADSRERHRGVSHHSLTSLGRVALAPADIAVPDLDEVDGIDSGFAAGVWAVAATLSPPHRLVSVPAAGLLDAVAVSPIEVSTMGRGLADDPAYFIGCAAAGRLAARMLA
jgi:hypothetical protein